MKWRYLIPHGSEIEIGVFNTVTIRRPGKPAVKLRRRLSAAKFVLLPICTEGQWLELRR